MSLTPHPRKEWAHRGNKGSPHSLAESALSRAASQYPCDVDPQGSTRTHTSSASVPPTFLQHLALLAAGVVWTSLSEPSQQTLLLLVKEENELNGAQYMMTQNTVTTTTTTNTVYGPSPRMDASYMVERVVQSESNRKQVVYLASGEGS